jgi:hypothetical protein
MPFEISEVHELLHGENKAEVVGSGGCATGGCLGSAPMAFDTGGIKMAPPIGQVPSALTQWPVQMHLINPVASYFNGADLLIAADCAGFAYGNFHEDYMKGRKMVIACPKLDQGQDIYIQKLVFLGYLHYFFKTGLMMPICCLETSFEMGLSRRWCHSTTSFVECEISRTQYPRTPHPDDNLH